MSSVDALALLFSVEYFIKISFHIRSCLSWCLSFNSWSVSVTTAVCLPWVNGNPLKNGDSSIITSIEDLAEKYNIMWTSLNDKEVWIVSEQLDSLKVKKTKETCMHNNRERLSKERIWVCVIWWFEWMANLWIFYWFCSARKSRNPVFLFW